MIFQATFYSGNKFRLDAIELLPEPICLAFEHRCAGEYEMPTVMLPRFVEVQKVHSTRAYAPNSTLTRLPEPLASM